MALAPGAAASYCLSSGHSLRMEARRQRGSQQQGGGNQIPWTAHYNPCSWHHVYSPPLGFSVIRADYIFIPFSHIWVVTKSLFYFYLF